MAGVTKCDQAASFSREQRWDEIPALVSDEMFHTIATVGSRVRQNCLNVERKIRKSDRSH